MLALTTFFPGCVFLKNVLQGGNPASYPLNKFFPATLADVLFVNFAGGNYRLQSISLYHNAGTEGKHVGGVSAALATPTVGAVRGGGSPPADTTPPSVSITAPVNGAIVS